MKEGKSIRERIQERLEDWKGELEELQVQLALGRKEAEERFEEQKERLRDWIERNRGRLDGLESEIGTEVQELRERLRQLAGQLEFGSPASAGQGYEEQKQKISQGMDQVREYLAQLVKTGSEKAEDLLEDWDDDFAKFRSRFEMLALQLHLARKEAGEELEELREEAREKLHEFKARLADASEDIGERLSWFRSEIRDSFDRFSGNFRDKTKGGDSSSEV